MRLTFSFLFSIGCGGELLESPPAFEPLAHDVEVRVDQGVAALTVHRAFRGVETAELELPIALPSAASVDRFRFAVNDRWIDGELLDAELASERFDLLSGLAGVEGHAVDGAPPPALLQHDGAGRVRLFAHPIAPEDTVELELRMLLPTCHAGGRALLDYPFDPSDPPSFSGAGTIRAPSEEDDFASACDRDATLLESDRVVIELDALEEIAATYAVQPIGERTAIRVAIDAPPELVPIPARPTIVFVMDGSYSQEDPGLADQLAWAQAYLAWVPDAEVEVVVFRREAERLFGRFVGAGELAGAIAALPAERLALGNGSFLDRGLELATSLLAGAGGETRIVATSDLMMRSALDPEAVVLGRAVLHLLQRDGPATGEAQLYTSSHDDELESLAHATGGIARTLSGGPTDESAIPVAEELVHPIRLDDVQLIGLADVTHDGFIDRGDRLRTTALLGERAPDRIEARALLWSAPVSFELSRSSVVESAMPAFLIATAPGLTEEELRETAIAGGVVSELTSYLAERGGVDPLAPPEEIGETFGIGGFGSFSTRCGCCGGWVGHGIQISTPWLREAVLELAEQCGAIAGSVWIETTDDEIADVGVEAESGGECLLEGIWSLRLDESYRERGRRMSSFNL